MQAPLRVCITHISDLPKYNHEKPYELWMAQEDLPAGEVATTNCEFDHVDGVSIHDLRQATIDCSINTSGFQFVKHQTAFHLSSVDVDPEQHSVALENYLEETLRVVSEELRVSQVLCFDWRVSTIPFRSAT